MVRQASVNDYIARTHFRYTKRASESTGVEMGVHTSTTKKRRLTGRDVPRRTSSSVSDKVRSSCACRTWLASSCLACEDRRREQRAAAPARWNLKSPFCNFCNPHSRRTRASCQVTRSTVCRLKRGGREGGWLLGGDRSNNDRKWRCGDRNEEAGA